MHKINLTFMSLMMLGIMILGSNIASAASNPSPVVVELFTSQGCSSCPSADNLLRELAANDPNIIPLSFHVDYWDYLGWKDPFSSSVNTQRQRRYAQTINDRGVYTPQAVVNGSRGVVGSDNSRLRSLIDTAHQASKSSLITLKENGQQLAIHVAASTLKEPAIIYAIRFQRNSSTDVKSGENSGRRLSSINSVTDIEKLGTTNGTEQTYALPLSDKTQQGIAIILQEKDQGVILSAAMY